MKRLVFLFSILINSLAFGQMSDSLFLSSIYQEALVEGEAYENLRSLCKDVGARLTGSAEAEMAVYWGERVLNTYGLDSVYLQPIEVPHWERGTKEAGWIVDDEGAIYPIHLSALGGSVGTDGLLSGELVIARDMDHLKSMSKAEVEGKTVFVNQAFNQGLLNTFSAYSGCWSMRGYGAVEAAKLGAKAIIIRSLASHIDPFPHTGSMYYVDSVQRIPAAAISTEDAEHIVALAENGSLSLRLEMDCRFYGNVPSYNVIGELHGRQKNKVVTFGGHLDSWDLGEGAHDDGAGIAHSMEAIRILKELEYEPEYTLRVVLFMNEENGNMGGKTYASWVNERGEEHIAALESDAGGGIPMGFGIVGDKKQVKFVRQFRDLYYPFGIYTLDPGYGGVDIGPLKDYFPGMLQLGLRPNSQEYFKYHHSDNDVFENVDKRELEMGCAAFCSMIYLVDKHYRP